MSKEGILQERLDYKRSASNKSNAKLGEYSRMLLQHERVPYKCFSCVTQSFIFLAMKKADPAA